MWTQEIIAEDFAPFRCFRWPSAAIRVVDWNIDRGLELPAILDFLAQANADIVLLQEVDVNARRTNRRNIGRMIAQKLKLNYVFGREFVELTQGSKSNPAWHGQATLSRWRIANPRVIRFRRQSSFWRPRWFLPNMEPLQERLGGRIALGAEIQLPGTTIATYNLHLESRGNDELRLAQMEEVLRDAERYDRGKVVVVAGDLNLNAARNGISEGLHRAGFMTAAPSASLPTTPPRHVLERGRHIDWVFMRGPAQIANGKVHSRTRGSDHYPLSLELRA